VATPVVVQWQMTVHHSSFAIHHPSFAVHHPSFAVHHPSLIVLQFEGSPGSVAIVGPQIGYTIPAFVVEDIVEGALLEFLVLHPISAGLAFLSLIFSLFFASRAFSVLTLVLTIITALAASLSLGIDLALVLVARRRLFNSEISETDNVTVGFGNGVWLGLAGVVLTWIAVFLLSARVCFRLGVPVCFCHFSFYMRRIQLKHAL
jgi:hypothetical protein